MFDLTLAGRARCLVVWLLATVTAALTIAWAAPDLRAVPGAATFDQLVVGVAAAGVAACAAWAWVVTAIVVAQALAGRPRVATPGVPRWLRVAVLVTCGLAVVGSGNAAHADGGSGSDPREVLAGLPPPERVLGAVRPLPAPSPEPADVNVVRAGDTLWDIAASDLGGRPDAASITAHWHAIHALNRAVIGADPDLIQPGQPLRMPAPPHHQ